MPVETSSLTEKAVYWAASGHNRNGEIRLSDPVEIDVRWEEGQQRSMDAQGTPLNIDAMIYLDTVLTTESIVWRGELDDLPDSPTNLYRVVFYEEVPDIKGVEVQRDAGLQRYGDTLPEVG